MNPEKHKRFRANLTLILAILLAVAVLVVVTLCFSPCRLLLSAYCDRFRFLVASY